MAGGGTDLHSRQLPEGNHPQPGGILSHTCGSLEHKYNLLDGEIQNFKRCGLRIDFVLHALQAMRYMMHEGLNSLSQKCLRMD